MSFHVFFHALDLKPRGYRVEVWRWKGRLDLRRCGRRLCSFGMELWRRYCMLNAAWHPSLYVELLSAQVGWCNACAGLA